MLDSLSTLGVVLYTAAMAFVAIISGFALYYQIRRGEAPWQNRKK